MLYLLGAALALMPLPIQLEGTVHNHLFPYVSKNISKITFPVNLEVITSFVIKGFDLVKLVYNCWNGGGNQNVSKTYYFGPTLKNLMQDKTEDIAANDTSIRVKCDTYYLNVGYLKGVKYNGIYAGVEDLDSTDSLRGKFSKGEKSISFVESDNGITIITCIYTTLDGSITTTTNFINKNKVVVPSSKDKELPNGARISSKPKTATSDTVKKEVKGAENNGIKNTKTFFEFFIQLYNHSCQFVLAMFLYKSVYHLS
uniref:DOMON domain-containing protein n=1 Tax=Strongyloides venezuelensis TaxID=75913 RepID=A0A0K0EYY2_STRVS